MKQAFRSGLLLHAVVCLTIMVTCLAAQSAGARDLRPDGTREGVVMTDLGDGVYQFTASFDGYVGRTNSVAIVGEDDVIIFDTHTRPSTARAVLAMLRQVTDKPVAVVINSHWHPDHWSGNSAYADAFPEARFVATRKTAEYMAAFAAAWPQGFSQYLEQSRVRFLEQERTGRSGDVTLSPQDIATLREVFQVRESFTSEAAVTRRVYPDTTFSGELTLNQSGRTIRLIEVNGDADGSAILFLEGKDLLITGDALVLPVQWPTNSDDIAAWRDSLALMRDLEPKVIVPGHGPAMRDTAYLDLVHDYLDSVIAQVRAALISGKRTPDDVRAEVDVSDFRGRFADGDEERGRLFDGYAQQFIAKAAREQRDGVEFRP